MDVLVCLSNYGDGQVAFLKEVVRAYGRMRRFRVHLIIDTTVPLDLRDCDPAPPVAQFSFPATVHQGLAFVHRHHVLENRNNYDLFVYAENDVLIREENLEALLEVTERLPDGYVTGLLRYEVGEPHGEPSLIDVHPNVPNIAERGILLGGKRFFRLHNPHQGSWILTREQLARAIDSGGFTTEPHYAELAGVFLGVLECGASDVYTRCGFAAKVYPEDGLERLLVHHLPDKYVRMARDAGDPGPFSLGQLKERFGG